MRPISLELEGFCSYREKTTIDFRDADFFVLVGPTGSGKSTVIDAMVFALYGTVPRWDDRGAVAPALAPTVNRGVVRLIFDVGHKRYAALRDIRRSGGKSQTVTIKEGRLEEFVDRNAVGGVDDETIPLATGRAVSSAVEKLLGLNFDQFTQSVALPQGEFARFLHSTDADRQAILKNLLGYTIYDQIQRAAYSRSAEAKSKAATLEEQLQDFTDATNEEVQRLSTEADAMRALQTRVVTVAVPALKTAMDGVAAARTSLGQLRTESALLAGVSKPEGVDELDAELQTRKVAVESAEEKQRAIESRDSDIRNRLRGLTPRHELERRLEHWSELKEIEPRLPELDLASSAAEGLLRTAEEQRAAAESAAAEARKAASDAAQAATAVEEKVLLVETALAELEDVEAPEGIDALGGELTAARAALESANSALISKEEEQMAASAAIELLPEAEALAAAKSAAEELASVIALDVGETASREAIDEEVGRARTVADDAANEYALAEQALHETQHADRASALRSELTVGDTCPVCGHEVVAIPERDDGADLRSAQDAVTAARAHAERAAKDLTKAQAAQTGSRAVRDERMQRCQALRSSLIGQLSTLEFATSLAVAEVEPDPSPDQLQQLQHDAESVLAAIAHKSHERAVAEARRRETESAVSSTRDAVRMATQSVDTLAAEARQALATLNAARDRLSSLRPPPADEADVSSSWKTLQEWSVDTAKALAAQRSALLTDARDRRAAAARLSAALDGAEQAARASNKACTDASLEKQRAETARDSTKRRVAELTEILSEVPTEADTAAELNHVKTLEAQLRGIADELAAAREAASLTRDARTQAENAVITSRQHLRRIRDPLAQYGAPEIAGTDLAKDWDLTVTWAAAEAQARDAQIAAQEQIIADAEVRLNEVTSALQEDLRRHGVNVDDQLDPVALADYAPAAVATSVANAVGSVERAKERRKQSEKMRREMKEAQETADVAHMLSQMMRAQGFPRWLLASALDALLRDASEILLELSGGQFELTRNEQDLLVVDHNEADMTRLVKTLSGGETFQASLALALALSAQVTSLSAAGASKLESIFLDEGFGTLDETTLDVVASTLETLASSASRMVGVITHVAALAERIPVRFQVNRDNSGSHIERLAV